MRVSGDGNWLVALAMVCLFCAGFPACVSGGCVVECGDPDDVVDGTGYEEPGPVSLSTDVAQLAATSDGLGPPEPVSIEVSLPQLEILEVPTHLEMHPCEECPSITAHYDNLFWPSIARVFTHGVREHFGGLRGCTHTTALLQAMAPIAMQCCWSMKSAGAKLDGLPTRCSTRSAMRIRYGAIARTRATCGTSTAQLSLLAKPGWPSRLRCSSAAGSREWA